MTLFIPVFELLTFILLSELERVEILFQVAWVEILSILY